MVRREICQKGSVSANGATLMDHVPQAADLMTNSQILVAGAAAIILLLGAAHLLLTFVGRKLMPRDPGLQATMQANHLRITRQTTVWKAWLGFNASHSLGAMLFGLVYGFLALEVPELLFHSAFLLLLGFGFLLGWLVLAIKYWFITPLAGISIASLLYAVAIGINAL